MDGRAQLPLIYWLQKNCKAEYVDMITEAGMDGYIVKNEELPFELVKKINISVQKHGSEQIFIVGHHDCGGHPVDKGTHIDHVKEAVDKVKKAKRNVKVTGVWLSEKWEVEKIIEK
jgi:carbonic anhydrase